MSYKPTFAEQSEELEEMLSALDSVLHCMRAYQGHLNLTFSDKDVEDMMGDVQREKDRVDELVAEEDAAETARLVRWYDRVRA